MSDRQLIALKGELITRQLGQMHRNRLENALERHEAIGVELSGVSIMTPSFADECFGVLAQMMGPKSFRARIRLSGASVELKHLVTAVIGQRLRPSTTETMRPDKAS